jgi:DNA topoisomerase-1
MSSKVKAKASDKSSDKACDTSYKACDTSSYKACDTSSYKLVIVESPAKCSKIESFLGAGYKCVASFGHIRELDNSFINIKKIDSSFKPAFTLMESKKQQIAKLRKMISEASDVFLASDDDREGEAISWHICDTFKLSIKDTKRIVFHEITESAIKKAIMNPRRIDMNIVYAQQARQVLDMIVGYKISPLLWKKISQHKKTGLSAGRCQTPALRIVYDNQREIDTSPSSQVYTTTGYFTSKNLDFTLNHQHESAEEMSSFLEESLNHEHIYKCGEIRNVNKKSPIPFTTSGLQQMASSELRISPKDTMSACQKLYEGGYITYMRTDSVVYSYEFLEKAEKYICKTYGDKYFRDTQVDREKEKENTKTKTKATKDKKKKDVEEEADSAHEAIRPTDIEVVEVDKELGNKEVRIYHLIRRNTLESCMESAIYKGVSACISAPYNKEYRYSTEQVVFPGWKIVDGYEKESPTFTYLQTLKSGSVLNYKKITSKVGLKNSKSHYTEATLVQLLEKNGIGRPSTFASLVDKIQEREYVLKEDVKGKTVECMDFTLEGEELLENKTKREMGNEKGKMVIQPTGTLVLEFLLKHFDKLFNYEYTKTMEEALDLVSKGEKEWYELCNDCLIDITSVLSEVEDEEDENINIKIDETHTYMIGKYGPVIKCREIEIDGGKGIKNRKKNKDSAVTFKKVKPDLDIGKLKRGEYTLNEILSTETKTETKELGKYNDNPIYLKNGQYGFYIEWRDIRKSVEPEVAEEMTLDDAIKLLSESSSTEKALLTIVRKVDDTTSIRTGKYGDYIFHKKKTMKTPKFYKLDDFVKDNKTEDGTEMSYRTCDISILSKWVYTKYKL